MLILFEGMELTLVDLGIARMSESLGLLLFGVALIALAGMVRRVMTRSGK